MIADYILKDWPLFNFRVNMAEATRYCRRRIQPGSVSWQVF